MSVISCMNDYINKAVNAVPGMKALLFDKYTVTMAGLVLSQSEIISREVYLTERIDMDSSSVNNTTKSLSNKGEIKDDSHESMHHLKAVVYIRPCMSSIEALRKKLKSNKYKDYYVFFSNICPDEYLRILAEGDDNELIRQVQELYGDYYAVDEGVFHANLPFTKPLYQQPAFWLSDTKSLFDRNSEAIISVLLSMKKRPDIRYSSTSDIAKLLALDVNKRIKEENDLFFFQGESPTLLIMDRRDDPVTPLLTQWTYQAMVHHIIGIHDNRVSLKNAPNVKKDLQEVVLSSTQDHFYRGSMYLNFGELGASVKDLVQNFQRKTQNHSKLDTIEDMQKFVDNYPEFRQMSGTVSKHVAIITEMSRIIDHTNLLSVSELEQELACNQDHSGAMDKLLQMMEHPKVAWEDKLRLVLLYALRYELQKHQLPQFKRLLKDKAGSDFKQIQRINAIDEMMKHAGAQARGGDLFGNKSVFSSVGQWVKSGLKGVENIYTQHKPLLHEILNNLLQGKLKNTTYPFVDNNSAMNASKTRSKLIFVYIIGGLTYEEAASVESINNANAGVRIILGGSHIHNSKSFIDDVLSAKLGEGDHSIDIES